MAQKNNVDVFATLHSSSTAASRAKVVQKKQSVISVQINRPIIRNISSNMCSNQPKSETFSHTCPTTLTDINDKYSNDSTKFRSKSASSDKDSKLSKVTTSKPKSCMLQIFLCKL